MDKTARATAIALMAAVQSIAMASTTAVAQNTPESPVYLPQVDSSVYLPQPEVPSGVYVEQIDQDARVAPVRQAQPQARRRTAPKPSPYTVTQPGGPVIGETNVVDFSERPEIGALPATHWTISAVLSSEVRVGIDALPTVGAGLVRR